LLGQSKLLQPSLMVFLSLFLLPPQKPSSFPSLFLSSEQRHGGALKEEAPWLVVGEDLGILFPDVSDFQRWLYVPTGQYIISGHVQTSSNRV
jgi:hypothetical protein